MSRQSIRSAGAVALCAGLGVSAQAQQVTANWLAPVNGSWIDATKWTTPNFPSNGNPAGTTYHARLGPVGGAYSVTLDQSVTIDRLTMAASGATLNLVAGQLNLRESSIVQAGKLRVDGGVIIGYGDLQVDGRLEFVSGTITTNASVGRLVIGAEGVFDVVGLGSRAIRRNVENFGVMNLSASITNVSEDILNHGTIVAHSETGSTSVIYGGLLPRTMTNVGLVRKTGGGLLRLLDGLAFHNESQVVVEAGTLQLSTGGVQTGDFEAHTGATIAFGGGHTLAESVDLFGDGGLAVEIGGFVHAGTTNMGGRSRLSSGESSFLQGAAFGQLDVNGGEHTFHKTVNASSLTVRNGTLNLTHDLEVNELNWSGGVVDGDVTLRLASGGAGTFSGTGAVFGSLENDGAILQTGGDIRFYDGSFINRGTLHVAGGGITMNGAEFVNEGTLTLSPSSNSILIKAPVATPAPVNTGAIIQNGSGYAAFESGWGPLVNDGTIHMQSGRLELRDGLVQTGSVVVDGGGTLHLGGDSVLTRDASSVVAGTVEFSGGVHDLDPNRWAISGAVRLSGGEITLHEPLQAALEAVEGTINYAYFTDLGTTFNAPVVQNFLAGYVVAPGSDLIIDNSAGGVGFGSSDLVFVNGDVRGALGGMGDLQFTNALEWRGGTMSGGLQAVTTVGPDGQLSLSESSKGLSRTLIINGDTSWSGGNVTLTGGSIVNNGVFTITASAQTRGVGANSFVNNGTLLGQSVGAATFGASGDLVFENNGAITISQGSMGFEKTLLNNGSIEVHEGATLRLGGTVVQGEGGSIIGAGAVAFLSGTHSLDKGFLATTGSISVGGGSVTVGTMLETPSWTFSGGTTSFLIDATTNSVFLEGGSISGAGGLTTQSLQWKSGVMLAGGEMEITPAGHLTFGTSAAQTRLLSRTLVSGGSAALDIGSLRIDGGEFENYGVMTVASGASIVGQGVGGSFVNIGTMHVSGVGVFELGGTSLAVENMGQIDVGAGSTLRLRAFIDEGHFGVVSGQGSVDFAAGSIAAHGGELGVTGAIAVSGADVVFGSTPNPSAWTFSGGSATFLEEFQGGSLLRTTGTELRFMGGVNLEPGAVLQISSLGSIRIDQTDAATSRVVHQGVELGGNADFVIEELLTWTGGSMTGTGRTIVAPDATATIGFFTALTLSRELAIQGSAGWGSTTLRLDGGMLRNEGMFTATAFQGGAALMSGLYGGGVLRNEGTLVVQGGGEVRLFRAGGDMALENTGVVEIREGSLRLLGSDVTSNEGVYDIRHGGAIEIDGGFENSSGAALSFEVGAMKDRGLSGLMTITGEASLAGSLTVMTPEAFSATWGDRWVVMTYGSVEGDFDVFDLPMDGFASRSDDFGASDLRWYAERGETEYAVGVSHVADIDHDGLIGFADLNVIASNFNAFGSWAQGDVDGDGFVGFTDLNAVLSLFNVAAPRSAPAPGGVVVMVMAAGAMGRRRER